MSIYSDAEADVRKLLEAEYQTLLPEMALQIGLSSIGKQRMHKFDGVSADHQIVFEVKSNRLIPSAQNPYGRYFSSIKWVLLGDIYLLSRVEARTKLFVLPHKELFDLFREDTDGILPADIQVIHKDIGHL